jgi:hypothetical protein
MRDGFFLSFRMCWYTVVCFGIILYDMVYGRIVWYSFVCSGTLSYILVRGGKNIIVNNL